jgi:hypothetical protein
VYLNPQTELSAVPLKSFYRYVIGAPLEFGPQVTASNSGPQPSLAGWLGLQQSPAASDQCLGRQADANRRSSSGQQC